MDLEVKIDAEAVQATVAQAIVNSAIGKEIEASINRAFKADRNYSSFDSRNLVQNAVDSALAEQLRKFAQEVIESHREEIRARVLEKFTDEVMDKMVGAAWAVMEGKLKRPGEY